MADDFARFDPPHHDYFGDEAHQMCHDSLQQSGIRVRRCWRNGFGHVAKKFIFAERGQQMNKDATDKKKRKHADYLKSKRLSVTFPEMHHKINQEEEHRWEESVILRANYQSKPKRFSIGKWQHEFPTESHFSPAPLDHMVGRVAGLGKIEELRFNVNPVPHYQRRVIIDQGNYNEPKFQMRNHCSEGILRYPMNVGNHQMIRNENRTEDVHHDFNRRKLTSDPKSFARLQRHEDQYIKMVRRHDATFARRSIDFSIQQSALGTKIPFAKEEHSFRNSSMSTFKRKLSSFNYKFPPKSWKSPTFVNESKRRKLSNEISPSILDSSQHSHISISKISNQVAKKRYSCPECGKRFAKRYYVKQHSKIHRNEYPFQCRYCESKFKHQSNLIAHEQVDAA